MSGTNPGTSPKHPAVSGAAWAQPQPQSVLGLSSNMVYGSAFSSSFPLAFQLATGGLFKLVVDPVGYAAMFPETAATPVLDLFGSGIGGNVQVTLGTVANISMGLKYNMHLGDEVKISSQDKAAMRTLELIVGGLMAVLAIAFQIAYGAIAEDDKRAEFVIAFQLSIQALVAVLMGAENAYYLMDHGVKHVLFDIFGPIEPEPDGSKGLGVYQNVLKTLLAAAVAPAAILPPILASQGEDKLNELLAGKSPDKGTQGSGAYISVSDQGAT